MKTSHASTRDLAAALKQSAQKTGEQSPSVRGADWRLATVTAIGAGTVTADSIVCRRLETYRNPVVGDVIVITQSSSGNWLAAGRTAVDSDGLGTVLYRRKAADTGPRTSATPSVDPHLAVTLAANATYTLEAFAKWSSDTNTSDMNWGWNVPTDAAGSWVCYADATSMTAVPSTVRNIDTAIGSPRSYGAIAPVTGHAMRGIIRTTTGGVFSANWSSQTAGGSGVTVYTDSWIRLERVE
ncbi:hypothetical protein [Streptomyces acidicola]|uniref:Uncharacterized protein n=1 Tax=Streptomyces acidicola TaxID=2596892 RepID=A0A5N8WLC7_9ACTN|nr:hypothetical protein [Streptomyces acidicola]MPY47169.1 hypothetical protein [Streptomyces acidicola]MPY47308.1 hypothetical protein [Streptomyces acidicola]